MKNIRQISEIAKLFHLPAATLHYWEKEQLFRIGRNPGNDYREYTLTDIMNIWEIVLYRKLGISLKEIRSILNADLSEQLHSYCRQEERISRQIEELEQIRRNLQRQENLARVVSGLQKAGLCQSVPDLSFCIRDPFDKASIELSLQNPSRCCMLITPDSTEKYIHAIIPEQIPAKKELLWQLSDFHSEYMEFLLRISISDPENNNLPSVCAELEKAGYRTGHTIARYLLIAGQENRRYEYYRAWIQVFSV